MAEFAVKSQHFVKEVREITKNLHQISWFLDRDLSSEPSDHDVGELPARLHILSVQTFGHIFRAI
jgi:hypothetical protein